jgi:hypothetical protein
MPNALTLETMSPGLLKVGETRSPEPHRRKSRMREIRSSGSGEGLGWATSQPTLQRSFATVPMGVHPLEQPDVRRAGLAGGRSPLRIQDSARPAPGWCRGAAALDRPLRTG